ncbi:YbaB/EbfC family nucleoid-associated protein [Streptomyces sp.]|uniref:YbaB/EbfC family nucleoid-associated protein n=1 Tax=Streptomyces sp. TaxID=1931 RepID=UPI002F406EE1
MDLDVESRIQAAMAAMREQRKRMTEARVELEKATASVTSKDRMVTVTVGPQGQVVSMAFHTTAYQDMAPAELAAALTGLLNEARARMGEQVTALLMSFTDVGRMIRAAAGAEDMPTDLDELMKPLRAMRPGFGTDEAKKRSGKQEEFGG